MTESPRTALGPGHDHHNGPLSNSDGAAQLDGACCAGTMRRWAARAPTHPSTLVATARATGYLSTSRSPWAAALVQRFGAFECFEVRLRFVWKFGISQRFARSQISRDSNYVRLITDLLSSCLFPSYRYLDNQRPVKYKVSLANQYEVSSQPRSGSQLSTGSQVSTGSQRFGFRIFDRRLWIAPDVGCLF